MTCAGSESPDVSQRQPETVAYLLVCIVSNTAKVNDILTRFRDLGVTGATVIDSHGTRSLTAEEVPLFSGFRHLLQGDREANRTILSVIREEETLARAMDAVSASCGDLAQPSTGIAFALPVSHVRGLRPRREGESEGEN